MLLLEEASADLAFEGLDLVLEENIVFLMFLALVGKFGLQLNCSVLELVEVVLVSSITCTDFVL